MNKLQTISLSITIILALHYAIHILLGFPLWFDWLEDHRLFQSLYAFLIGLCAFINLTIFHKDNP